MDSASSLRARNGDRRARARWRAARRDRWPSSGRRSSRTGRCRAPSGRAGTVCRAMPQGGRPSRTSSSRAPPARRPSSASPSWRWSSGPGSPATRSRAARGRRHGAPACGRVPPPPPHLAGPSPKPPSARRPPSPSVAPSRSSGHSSTRRKARRPRDVRAGRKCPQPSIGPLVTLSRLNNDIRRYRGGWTGNVAGRQAALRMAPGVRMHRFAICSHSRRRALNSIGVC